VKTIPINKLIEIARLAPSGDNLQPWHFNADENNKLSLAYRPSPIVEPEYYVSGIYSSMGIMIEYVTLAAGHLGFATKVKLNPNFHPEHNRRIADFEFSFNENASSKKEIDSLVEAMTTRHTTREIFSNQTLPNGIIDDLKRSAGEGSLYWFDDKKSRSLVIKALSLSDNFFWRYNKTRTALVESIYSKKAEPDRKYGMPTSTLGAGPLEPVLKSYFSLAEKFPLLWNSVRLKATRDTAKGIHNSAGVGFITVPSTGPKKFVDSNWTGHDHIEGGKQVARLWLTATKHGLLFQPLYHLVAMSNHQGNKNLNKNFDKANPEVLSILRNLIQLDSEETLVFAFRVGYPTIRTSSQSDSPRYSVQELLD